MLAHSPSSHELIPAGSLLGGGVVLAVVLRLALAPLQARAARTTTGVDDLVVRAVREALPAAFVIGGIWLAGLQLPLTASVRHATDRWYVVALVVVFTVVAARLGAQSTRVLTSRRSGVAPASSIFATLIRFVVLVIGFLVLLETLGISITPLLTALGVGGLAVALALQDTLTNLFAGIHILASKKIEPGDYIKLSTGDEGYVVDVNWRNTAIRELPDNMILVPNSVLSAGIVVNYHRPFSEMSVVVQVGVSYSSDLEHVEQVTIQVAREVMSEVEGGVTDRDPFIRYHTFGDSSIDFSVIMRSKEYADKFLITHEFVKRLHRRYQSEGIEIPFPIRTIVQAGTSTQ